MIKRKSFPKIFFGWWMVLVIGNVVGLGQSYYSYAFSVFFKPMASELGFNRAVTSVAAGIGRLEGGIEAPLTGWLSDRFGPRFVIIIGVFIAGLGLVLMKFINSLWSFYLVWGLVGIGSNLGFTIATDKALTNWFIKKRGMAFGIKFVLHGICGVIMLPIVSWLVNVYGWRMANLIWAWVVFSGAPLLWFFIKPHRPEYYGLLPDGAEVGEMTENVEQMIDKGLDYAASFQETEFTIRQALKTKSFWMIVIATASGNLAVQALNIHLIPFLTDINISQNVAANMMAMMIFFTIPARFIGGLIADHTRKENLQFLMAGAFMFIATGIGILLLNQTIVMIYVFLILYGFGSGVTTPLQLTLRGRYFGRKAFTSIIGISSLLTAPLGFLAPIYAGWIYDTTGSYRTAFVTLTILVTFAVFLMCLIKPPKPPVSDGDVRKFF